jgi:outer membrane receptor for monomeric catechols
MKTPPSILCRPLIALLASICFGEVNAQTKKNEPTSSSSHSDQTIVLSPFEVTASSDTGYGAQTASSASRLNLRYIDVPQSVSVVTQELMQDAFVFDSQEITKLVPGIQARANSHQPGTFYSRGIQISHTYVDGFIAPLAINRYRALYDRVEYVKGPASAAMGRGEAGGLVNYVSKSPLPKNRNTISVTIGTDNFYNFEADHNQLIGRDGKMAFRVPVYFMDTDGQRGGKLMHSRYYGIGPSFRWNISSKATLNFNTTYGYAQNPGPVGEAYWQDPNWYRGQVEIGQILPSQVNANWMPGRDPYIPNERVFGWEGKGRVSEIQSATLRFIYKFTDSLSYRQGISYSHVDEEYRRFALAPTALPDPNAPGDFRVGITYLHEYRENSSTRYQGDFLYEHDIANTKHQFLVGYDYFKGDNDTVSGSRGGLSQSLYNPDYNLPAGFNPNTYVTTFSNSNQQKVDGFGYYWQYSGNFLNDKINVMYGWRKDITGSSTFNRRTGATLNPDDLTTDVPRYSITYKPTENISTYLVHSEQADPRRTQAKYNNILPSTGAVGWADDDPRRQETLTAAVTASLDELGVKASLFDGKITASFALFEIRRDGFILNQFKAEPSRNGVGSVGYNELYVANGESVRGFEFEVFGKIEQLTVNASISSLDGSKIAANGSTIPMEALIDSAQIYLKYSFRDNKGNGFEINGASKLMFKGWIMLPGSTNPFSANQFYIDAGMSYYWRNGRYSAALRGNNLTNEMIYISGNSQLPLRRIYASFNTSF